MISACMALIDSKAQREEFEIFYNDNKNLGYSKAYSLLHDEQAAEDALSEAFLRLAKCFQKVHNLSSHKLRAYFVIIVKNVAIDMLRHSGSVNEIRFDDEIDYSDSEIEDVNIERLEECIKRLSEADRELLYLRYELELSHIDIAKSFGITEAASRQRLRHAKAKLKAELLKE